MIKKISEDIWKIIAGSNIYFLDFEQKILIDTGDRAYRQELETFLHRLIEPEKITQVIFTHLHYDHVGNFDLFKNAKFFASEQAIEDFQNNPKGTVHSSEIAARMKDLQLNPVKDIAGLQIIQSPGHTRGSICLWHEKERILFSGDTIFDRGLGRTDLPTSVPEEMQKTVMRLMELNHRILCPGHDY